ncbi:MAG: DUF5107 domain-containing protein [Verrucomicrobiae bacterium]|nr:DUF5107 domain-containing protein [Verrucomicrobiae bacterium]
MDMRIALIAACGAIAPLGSVGSEPVRAWEEALEVPTYEMGAPDRNPVFVTRRSYQGAEAPVYPYPMWDAVGDRRVSKAYRAVYLENRYVQICVLPEIGGRVFSARDKTSGYDFLYRQHVIKPALIGMVGAWISGGIEWNIPHHHRASTFMPVDCSFAREPDGSAVVRVGELELRHRMRWVVELRLRPDSSCVEQTVRLVNRTPSANSFLFFANIAVHANADYQVIFPPDCRWVTNHGKREFARWPVSGSIYNGIDFRKGVDVSWWRNHTSPISMFAWGSGMDFVGGYDHGRGAGFVHVADRHTSPGKKFFTWGGGESGRAWDRALTDSDGPYIELMAGSYSDNQPDYSWIKPYQTKVAETFWYPVGGIGGAKNANRDAAVNLEVAGGVAKIGVAVTAERPDLTVTLAGSAGALFEKKASAGPGRPFVAECGVPEGVGGLTLRVIQGQLELISYAAVEDSAGEAPETVRPPDRPESIQGIEDVYQAGLRLEQLHSAALDPEDYYREVLRRDPGHARANTAMGIRAWQRCLHPDAERYLGVATARPTALYLAPRDGEPHYYLGLVLRAQGKDREAWAAFERAAWDAGWESAARYQLAEMSSARGDHGGAEAQLDRALSGNSMHVKALVLKAAVLRRSGRAKEATCLLERAAALDPLDPWLACERALAEGTAPAVKGDGPQASLEAATDYMGAGMWEDAAAVLAAAGGKAATDPMVLYTLGFCLERLGRPDAAIDRYGAAAEASPDYVFPFRRESFDVLLRARERNPRDHRAAYYLGNLYMLHGQRERAVAQWEDSRTLNPAFALVHRNLALAYAGRPKGMPAAVESMEAAVDRDPSEPRFCLEMDQLYEAANVPAEKRLAFLEAHHGVVARRDDALSREIALLVEVGRLDRAMELIAGRQFHIWEGGGRTAVHNSYSEAHMILGRRHFEAKRYPEALREFELALEYPENLGMGRPVRGERLPETYYAIGLTREAMGDRGAAAESFGMAVATGPADLAPKRPAATDEPEIYYYAARALERLGRAREAAGVYAGLVEAGKAQLADHVPMYFFASFGHPQSEEARFAQAHYVIGLGLLGLNRGGEAREAFGRALELDPGHGAAKRQMKTSAEGSGAADAAPILTPKPKPEPRINGARVFGVRPGRPILYTIAATGDRPMRFSAEGLPAGATLDAAKGRIGGSVAERGTYRVMIRAENARGRAERELRLVVGDDICLTPLLGCNTYGGWGARVTEANVRAAAEAMVRLGLIDHGWQYVNIDDGWQGERGGKHNAIQPNEKFGDLRALCAHIHGLGLKAGIYSTPWVTSYEGFAGGSSDDPRGAWQRPARPKDGYFYGRYFFETNDARQWAEWGFDYAKYDWGIDSAEVARRMADALAACDRDIVLELSNSLPINLARDCVSLAQLSRTTGDLVDLWDRSQMDASLSKWAVGIREVMLAHDAYAPFQRPGHWNHACNLRVGLLGGWRKQPLTPSRLTPDEQYSHISLWCLWGSPMIIGTPIERLDEFTLGLLTNDEVLEVNQDPLGKQAVRIVLPGGGEALCKELEDGTRAVGLFNVGADPATVSLKWADLGIAGPQRVRDLWRQRNLGIFNDGFGVKVAPHGVMLLRVFAADGR